MAAWPSTISPNGKSRRDGRLRVDGQAISVGGHLSISCPRPRLPFAQCPTSLCRSVFVSSLSRASCPLIKLLLSDQVEGPLVFAQRRWANNASGTLYEASTKSQIIGTFVPHYPFLSFCCVRFHLPLTMNVTNFWCLIWVNTLLLFFISVDADFGKRVSVCDV